MRWVVELPAPSGGTAATVTVDADSWAGALTHARGGSPIKKFRCEFDADNVVRVLDLATRDWYTIKPFRGASADATSQRPAAKPVGDTPRPVVAAEAPAAPAAVVPTPKAPVVEPPPAVSSVAEASAPQAPASTIVPPSPEPEASVAAPEAPTAASATPESDPVATAAPGFATPVEAAAPPADSAPEPAPVTVSSPEPAPPAATPAAAASDAGSRHDATSGHGTLFGVPPPRSDESRLVAVADQSAPYPAPSIVPTLLFERDQDPGESNPLTYRERVYVVPEGTTSQQAEQVARHAFSAIKRALATRPRGRYVIVAVFDHAFEVRPARAALVELRWKDWRGDVDVSFPTTIAPLNGSASASPQSAIVTVPDGATMSVTADASGSVDASAAVAAAAEAPPSAVASPSENAPPAEIPAVEAPVVVASEVPAVEASVVIASEVPAAAIESPAPAVESPAPEVEAPAPAPAIEAAEPSGDVPPSVIAAAVEAAPVESPAATVVVETTSPPAAPPSPEPVSEAKPVETAAPAPTDAPAPAPVEVVPPPPAADESSVIIAEEPASPPAVATIGPEAGAASLAEAPVSPSPVVSGTPTLRPAAPDESAPAPAPRTLSKRLRGKDLLSELFDSLMDLSHMEHAEEASSFVAKLMLETVQCDASAVSLYDIDRDEFVVIAANGGDGLQGRREKATRGAPGQMVRRKLGVMIERCEPDDALIAGASNGGALFAPAYHRDRLFAMVRLHRVRGADSFQADELDALSYVAGQLGEFLATHSKRVGAAEFTAEPKRNSMPPRRSVPPAGKR